MMENNKTIGVVIPVHSVAGDFKKYMDNALLSIKNQQVQPDKVYIIRCTCKDVKAVLDGYDFGDLTVEVLENTVSKDFPTQINVAAKLMDTDYISILEFDDEYSKTWFKNVKSHIETYPNVSMFLPITVDVDVAGKSIGLMNEMAWAMNFTSNHGYLDTDAVLTYPNFSISGAIINREDFIASGGIKKNLKLSFIYEFILRYLNLGNSVFTIPKVGYKHTNLRENSLFYNYRYSETDKLTPAEGKFWMEKARTEYYHKLDREINMSD